MAKVANQVWLASLVALSLTGCVGAGFSYKNEVPVTQADIITIDGVKTDITSNDQTAERLLTEENYRLYKARMDRLRSEAQYQDIEEQYQQARINWYSRFLKAFSLGIIDAEGNPTGKIEDIRFTLDVLTDEQALERLKVGNKEEFIRQLRSMYFCTEGPNEDYGYPDVLLYRFTTTDPITGEQVYWGYETKEQLETVTLEELQGWFNEFIKVEREHLGTKTDKIALTKEELQELAVDLLKTDYVSPVTDTYIETDEDGRHRIKRDYLNSKAQIYMERPIARITLFGEQVPIQIEGEKEIQYSDLSITYTVVNEQDVQENEVAPIYGYKLSLSVNGVPRVYNVQSANNSERLSFRDNELTELLTATTVCRYTEFGPGVTDTRNTQKAGEKGNADTDAGNTYTDAGNTDTDAGNTDTDAGNGHSPDMLY